MVLKVGIMGAMDEEISIYLKNISCPKKTKWKIFTFYEGLIENKNIVLVKSGVGKVFASMICQVLIDKFGVDTILFTGVGGALNKKLNIGDVVVSADSAHHDFNAMPLGFKRGQISYTNYRFFKSEERLVDFALKTKLHNNKIIKGRILTGDQFFTQADKKNHAYLVEELKGDCIEMEGAAVAQVCDVNKIPHLIIRTISDKSDGTAVEDYKKFKSKVASNSLNVTKTILNNI